MKGVVKLEKTGAKLTDDWFTSPERDKALFNFLGVTDEHDNIENYRGDNFLNSKYFANARHAYRKRING